MNVISKLKRAYNMRKKQDFQKKYNFVKREFTEMYTRRWFDLKQTEMLPVYLAEEQMQDIVKNGDLDWYYKHCLSYRKYVNERRKTYGMGRCVS